MTERLLPPAPPERAGLRTLTRAACDNAILASLPQEERLAVSLRTCDPETRIDWHRVAGSATPAMMSHLAKQNRLSHPAFLQTQENDFAITLGDLVPTLTGEED